MSEWMVVALLTLLVVGAYGVMEVLDWAAARVLLQAGVQFEARLAPLL